MREMRGGHDDNVGSCHGRVHEAVRNPFRKPLLRQQFDQAVSAYDACHRNPHAGRTQVQGKLLGHPVLAWLRRSRREHVGRSVYTVIRLYLVACRA